MAFSRAGLQRASSGGNTSAPVMWTYNTTDTAAQVQVEDYFLDAINEIKLGDIMFQRTSTGGTPVVTISYCNQNDGTNIDFVDGDVITNTDSD